jgi:hypothetical protein
LRRLLDHPAFSASSKRLTRAPAGTPRTRASGAHRPRPRAARHGRRELLLRLKPTRPTRDVSRRRRHRARPRRRATAACAGMRRVVVEARARGGRASPGAESAPAR